MWVRGPRGRESALGGAEFAGRESMLVSKGSARKGIRHDLALFHAFRSHSSFLCVTFRVPSLAPVATLYSRSSYVRVLFLSR